MKNLSRVRILGTLSAIFERTSIGQNICSKFALISNSLAFHELSIGNNSLTVIILRNYLLVAISNISKEFSITTTPFSIT